MKKIIKIIRARLKGFLNNEHYNFIRDVLDLIVKYDAKKMKVEKEHIALAALYEKEGKAYDFIRVSEFTPSIRKVDKTRMSIKSALVKLAKINLISPNEAVAKAARRLTLLFDAHNDTYRRSYNSKTAIITDILNDIKENYAADIELLNASNWVVQLENTNNDFIALMKKRFNEEISYPNNMNIVRAEVDDAFTTFTTRLEALMVIEEPEKFFPLAEELNRYIAYYNERVKQRIAHNKNKNMDIDDAQLSPIEVQKYTGLKVIPDITLTYIDPKTGEAFVLVEDKDYTIKCTNNIKPGTATLTAKAKGKYIGKMTTKFNIAE